MTRRHLTVLSVFAALSLAARPSVSEPLVKEVQDWVSGPVSYLFTDADRAAWKSVTTNEQAAEFANLFWARRDPTAGTPANEFKVEFERRVATADKRFTQGAKRGAMSDQGRVMILLGPPTRISRVGQEDAAQEGGGGGGSDQDTAETPRERSTPQVWSYDEDKLPTILDRKHFDVTFRPHPNSGDMIVSSNSALESYLKKAATVALAHPELAAVPPAVASAVAPTASSAKAFWRGEALSDATIAAALAAPPAGSERLNATLETSTFEAGDGTWTVQLQVATRADVSSLGDLALVGEAVSPQGAVTAAFISKQPWDESKGQHYLQQSLVLPPGSYEVRVGLSAAQGVLWTSKSTVVVPEPAGLWISGLLFSEDIHSIKKVQDRLQPFTWNNVSVIPKVDSKFAAGGPMWVYLHVCNPGLGPDGQPALSMVAEVTGPKKFRGPLQPTVVKASGTCWAVAQSFDLMPDTFPAGAYDFKLQVTDPASHSTLTTTRGFSVVAAGQ
ncbi:MAG: GWxTD domain-containing protein [Acidobacteriota bacterium]